jgi:hypothetical protein
MSSQGTVTAVVKFMTESSQTPSPLASQPVELPLARSPQASWFGEVSAVR